MATTVQEEAALRVVASVLRAQVDELPASSGIARQFTTLAARFVEVAGPRPPDRQLEERERCRQEMLLFDQVRKEADAAWGTLSRGGREKLVFEALGDERPPIPVITERVNRALGYPKDGCRVTAVHPAEIRNLVVRLVRNGQLEREPEPFMGKLRYRYSPKRELAGPIAELERSFRDDEAVA